MSEVILHMHIEVQVHVHEQNLLGGPYIQIFYCIDQNETPLDTPKHPCLFLVIYAQDSE